VPLTLLARADEVIAEPEDETPVLHRLAVRRLRLPRRVRNDQQCR
jgi:hypothetical protein